MAGGRPGLRKRIGLGLFADLYADKVRQHRLRTLFWECTLRCNLACRHCGSDCRVDPGVKDMPLEDFLRVLDEQVTPHVDPRSVLLIFSGGEVLVRPDLEVAGAEVTRRGYPWGMVTNGMALDDARLRSLMDAGLRSVSVSFDGFEQEHNYIRRNPRSFDRALEAIRRIVRQPGLAYDVITCVTGQMVPRLEEFKELLIAEGVGWWRLFTIFPVGRARNDESLRLTDGQFREVLEFIRRTRREGRIDVSYACEGFLGRYEGEVRDDFYQCAAGVSVASIRVDGAISGCTSIRSNFHQGNVGAGRLCAGQYLPRRFLGGLAKPLPAFPRPLLGPHGCVRHLRYVPLLPGRRDAPARRRRCIALLPLSSALTSSSYLFRDLYSGIALASIVRGHRNNALSCIFRAVVLSGGSAYCRFPARALFHLPYFLRIHRQYPVMGSVAPSMAAAKARIRVNRPPQLPTCTE